MPWGCAEGSGATPSRACTSAIGSGSSSSKRVARVIRAARPRRHARHTSRAIPGSTRSGTLNGVNASEIRSARSDQMPSVNPISKSSPARSRS